MAAKLRNVAACEYGAKMNRRFAVYTVGGVLTVVGGFGSHSRP
jgi:hypothetical protein